MSKVLVSYFSASGVTKGVAEKIAKAVGGDLFEIEPTEEYTKEDLNWMNKQSRSSIEMADKECRPKIVNKVNNLDKYDTVVIGFPVWWYVAPRIINTFLDENDLKGKKVYIFVTSGGSGSEGCFEDLKKNYPDITFIGNKRFTGRESNEDYISFLK